MTYLTLDEVKRPLEEFQKFDTDTQLALLWYGYLDLKEPLNPAPPQDVENLAGGLFNQIKALSRQEQLQAQRDIANRVDNSFSRSYGSLSPSAKLEFWLLLGKGMEEGTIIGMPEDYELPENTNEFVNMIKELNFEQRINFTRNAVAEMGTKS